MRSNFTPQMSSSGIAGTKRPRTIQEPMARRPLAAVQLLQLLLRRHLFLIPLFLRLHLFATLPLLRLYLFLGLPLLRLLLPLPPLRLLFTLPFLRLLLSLPYRLLPPRPPWGWKRVPLRLSRSGQSSGDLLVESCFWRFWHSSESSWPTDVETTLKTDVLAALLPAPKTTPLLRMVARNTCLLFWMVAMRSDCL